MALCEDDLRHDLETQAHFSPGLAEEFVKMHRALDTMKPAGRAPQNATKTQLENFAEELARGQTRPGHRG